MTGFTVFRPVFFLHALSSAQPLTLASLKALIAEVFITRNDPRIQELAAERRPGRPKTTEHLEMEELRRREQTEFETGFGMSPSPCLNYGVVFTASE